MNYIDTIKEDKVEADVVNCEDVKQLMSDVELKIGFSLVGSFVSLGRNKISTIP